MGSFRILVHEYLKAFDRPHTLRFFFIIVFPILATISSSLFFVDYINAWLVIQIAKNETKDEVTILKTASKSHRPIFFPGTNFIL